MSANTKIEWSDATWNPVLGCSKVSPGCASCYAIQAAWVKQSNPNPKVRAAYEGLVEKRPDGSLNWTGRVNAIPERLEIPLRWRSPKRIFVNSLSDLFHENVSDDFIDKVFGVMALARHHTFQVLTKRPERMAAWFSERFQYRTIDGGVSWGDRSDRVFEAMQDFTDPSNDDHFDAGGNFVWPGWPLPNVWLGTSTEDQRTADERIPHLLRTPAAVRFLSCEPLLGPVDLSSRYMVLGYCETPEPLISWVIAGGESGPKHRPMNLDWARSLRDQCAAAGVAFHFKQVGGRTPKANGRLLDGRTWDEFPTTPAAV